RRQETCAQVHACCNARQAPNLRLWVVSAPGGWDDRVAMAATSDVEPGPGRIRQIFSGSRDLARVVWRDPEHVSERLTLMLCERLGAPSGVWAETTRRDRAGTSPAVIGEDLRQRSIRIARVDGAISGTDRKSVV